MKTAARGVVLVAWVCAAAAPLAVQRTYLQDVLDRAAIYVAAYEKECSAVVAEEHYSQQLVSAGRDDAKAGVVDRAQPPPDPRSWSSGTDTSRDPRNAGPSHRELVSDVLIVQLPDQSWFGFRDVALVDGHPVRDRVERLQQLFLQSRADLKRVQEESARYNIGPVYRTMNLPTFALAFLHPGIRHRFSFEQEGEAVIDATPVMVVKFAERSSPTVITNGRGTDVVSTGRVWIHPPTGRVLRTQLVAGGPANDVRAETTVDYTLHEDWGFLLPATMREAYDTPTKRDARRIVCTATYSNFRRFSVKVDESIKPPK